MEGRFMKKSISSSSPKTIKSRLVLASRESESKKSSLTLTNTSSLIPLTYLNNIRAEGMSCELAPYKKSMLTTTQQFMSKVKKDKVHPLPSIFNIIKIKDQNNSNNNKIDKKEYDRFNFNILSCSNMKLIYVASDIICNFSFLDFSSRLGVTRLIREIQSGYNVVSYHNFAHGFSLMHMYYQLLLLDEKFKGLFSKEETGFILIAALAHDINHPGTNNAYEVKLNSELSQQADKEAVLQKMHLKTFFNILKSKNISILEKSKNPQQNKDLIVRAVLSTDFARHFKGVQQLKEMREKKEFDPLNPNQRNFVFEQAFHACDIGNPCLEFQDYMNWAALLTYEFDYQTALQASRGIEVSEMLRYKGIKAFYTGQVGFVNFLAYPLWKELSELWPGFGPLIKNMQNNVKLLKQCEAEADKENEA